MQSGAAVRPRTLSPQLEQSEVRGILRRTHEVTHAYFLKHNKDQYTRRFRYEGAVGKIT